MEKKLIPTMYSFKLNKDEIWSLSVELYKGKKVVKNGYVDLKEPVLERIERVNAYLINATGKNRKAGDGFRIQSDEIWDEIEKILNKE